MQDKSIEARREQVVASLNSVREAHEKCLGDVSADVGNRGSEWSIADLLRHTNGEGYPNRIRRLLEEESPKLPGFDQDGAWRQLVETTLGRIDKALDWATKKEYSEVEKLLREAEKGNRPSLKDVGLESPRHDTDFDEESRARRKEILKRFVSNNSKAGGKGGF